MRLKLYNGGVTTLNLDVLSGSFDIEVGAFVLIVKAGNGHAGTLVVDAKESGPLVSMLTTKPEQKQSL